jgi:hypothetical protein
LSLRVDGLDRPRKLALPPFEGGEASGKLVFSVRGRLLTRAGDRPLGPAHCRLAPVELGLAQRQVELSLLDRLLEVHAAQRGDSLGWELRRRRLLKNRL